MAAVQPCMEIVPAGLLCRFFTSIKPGCREIDLEEAHLPKLHRLHIHGMGRVVYQKVDGLIA